MLQPHADLQHAAAGSGGPIQMEVLPCKAPQLPGRQISLLGLH